ncbi:MAG: TCR/Tet family MFS transporter [Sediminibacterium sp. Gen4]|jgi:MFS transporter, DHA1 family, tetracycline resistance protein|uniref:TCR/Tet family MFS transporter n=1 Tax=unclassified Sediminibacterium TaxID=2635961 RepID=UPI0015BA25D3|nr:MULTISPECIES: TCR/Tet family MFS transporter [unclassified Sediminibacterium]MBW0161937.1 TCR/Tet family MFS transporter [Sediminibacterium sp.]MBW0165296.1 TCR/Tet family MFS transporter [Sediminibacterium sp.]NWK65086.1 TCR/Tet family MFS transporter [Sediminibacterium sp. Gen4]
MQNRKAAIGFIFITLLIDVTGLGLIIPVMPKLIEDLLQTSDISKASQYGGWLTFAYAFVQFLFAPVLGNLSDKYGRRPVLLFSLLGFGIDYLFLSFAPTIGWLFIGRVIAGITGASFTTASAYIADISTPENRAQNFGMIGAAFGLGFILGPMIGGLLGELGARVPFFVAAGLALLNCAYGYFVLPESLSKENRRNFEWRRANPVGSLLQLKKYPAVAGLIISMILIYIAGHAVQSNWSFFNIERFGWSPKMIGISLGIVGLLVGGVQGGLVRVINPRIGNEKSVYVGLGLYALGLVLFAFATEGWMMFVFLIPYCLGGIAGPALQSIISGHVPPNEQGELQGALTSLMSATSIIGPPLMTNLFAYFTHKEAPVYFPGAAFFLGALLMIASTYYAYKALHTKTSI